MDSGRARPPGQAALLGGHLSTLGKVARVAIHKCGQQRAPEPHFCWASLCWVCCPPARLPRAPGEAHGAVPLHLEAWRFGKETGVRCLSPPSCRHAASHGLRLQLDKCPSIPGKYLVRFRSPRPLESETCRS